MEQRRGSIFILRRKPSLISRFSQILDFFGNNGMRATPKAYGIPEYALPHIDGVLERIGDLSCVLATQFCNDILYDEHLGLGRLTRRGQMHHPCLLPFR